MIILIDNYDSFTHNLMRYFQEIDQDIVVCRHDEITLADIEALNPTHLVISPGPGTPDQAGISMAAINHFAGRIPILGVCLGHQCIGQLYGAKIVRAKRPMHGKTGLISHMSTSLFQGLPNPMRVTRYHSLVMDQAPACLEVLSKTDEGEIMAVKHKTMPIYGVQFHPEAVLTEGGHKLLRNFLVYTQDESKCGLYER